MIVTYLMRDRLARRFCSHWSCKWPQKKNRSCYWCAWCISEQVCRRMPWHRSSVWRYWISQGSPEHDAEVLLELLSFVKIQFQNSPPTQKAQMGFCNQLIKSSHCNMVTLSWERLFWKTLLCDCMLIVQSLCEPPFIKNSLATAPHQVETTDAQQQLQVCTARWDVQLHGETGETGTGQTGSGGPVRSSMMLGLAQAGYETPCDRVASTGKSPALPFFNLLSFKFLS